MKVLYKTNLTLIKRFIEINKLSKTEFCKITGISRGTFERILKNQNVRLRAFLKISKMLNVKLNELFLD